jgi:hypothetical protein
LVGELDSLAQRHEAILRANLADGGFVARRTLGVRKVA